MKAINYTGMKFLLPNNKTEYTVKEKLNTKVGTTYEYILECSECSKDTELWPYGSIVACSGNFRKATHYHCGCSSVTNYTKEQYYILCRRKAEELGFKFVDIRDFDNERKCILQNNTGTVWELGVHVFLSKGTTDPDKRKVKHLSVDKTITLLENTGLYPEGTIFGKDEKGWYYDCGICSTDELAIEGIGKTRFYNRMSRLKIGIKSCRCSSGYKYSEEEYDYIIKNICEKEDTTYIGFPIFVNSRSKFQWVCSKGHLNFSNPWGFIHGGFRCDDCRKEITCLYGRFPDRLDEKDFLYVVNIDNNYIKVGRSFTVKARLEGLRSKEQSNSKNIKLLALFTDNHDNIWNLEQDIHHELRRLGYEFKHSFWYSNELFTLDSINDLQKILTKYPYKQIKQWEDDCVNVEDINL